MATLAEMFIGDVQQQNQQPLSKSDVGWSMGAQLAERQQKAQEFQQQLKQKQQELELAKYDKVGSWFDAASKMPDGPDKKAFKENFIPNGIQAMGLQDKIHPMVLDMMTKNSKLATGVISAIRNKEVPVSALGDPETIARKYPNLLRLGSAQEIAALAAEYPTEFGKAEEQALDREASVKAAGMRAGGTQERFDTKRGDNLRTALADKVNALGIPDIKVALDELNGSVPGGIDGYKKGTAIPGISGGEAALPINRLSGRALQVRQSAQSVGNQILKLRSGAAVTDGEAKRTLAELGMVPTIGEGGEWTGLAWKGTTSPEVFINGMKRARNIVAAKEKIYKNAYGADTYKTVVGEVVGSSDMKNKARKYLEQFPNGKDADRARKILGE